MKLKCIPRFYAEVKCRQCSRTDRKEVDTCYVEYNGIGEDWEFTNADDVWADLLPEWHCNEDFDLCPDHTTESVEDE